MTVIATSAYAPRDNKQSRGNPVTPSHNPIKAQAKDVSGSDSDSRNDLGLRRHGNLRGSFIARMDYKDLCLTCLVTLAAINTVLNLRSQRRR